jgi:hypothetical protein
MKHLLVLSAIATILVSCSNNTVTPESTTLKVPATGSSYTFLMYSTDTLDVKVPGSDGSVLATVVSSGITFLGKSGVWVIAAESIESDSTQYTDTTYFCVDQNNDVLFNGEGSLTGDLWLRLPVTSGKAFKDSTSSQDEIGGIQVEQRIVVTSSRIGQEQLTIGTTTIQTVKLSVNITAKSIALGQVIGEMALPSTVWYAPSLGNIVRMEQPSIKFGDPDLDINLFGQYKLLQSYNLK